MKHILHLVCIALPLVCGADIATAFAQVGLPPAHGPGSLFYGQPEKGGDPVVPTQKSQRRQKNSQQESGSRSRQVLPKQSQ
ncbi:hypothetical protein [Bradyrhizobium sp.]|jgi:hypothetical protein|uniref:hypothetical protein n=1 Tax=Bradyrhizobium sp. TaxID=376 RepID=UPI002D80F049|nr:hypothetical protein [Bradyrhizobium sp.]